MSMAARYGHISPLDFEEMDFEEAKYVAEQCYQKYVDEFETNANLHQELTKALMKSNSDTLSAIARSMAH
jgi:hypothetical protein